MRVAVHNHQNKADGLIQALFAAGHELVEDRPDLLLIDFDGPPYYRRIIDRFAAQGARILLYPHGAMAHLAFDGIWPVSKHVAGYLAMSPGQAAVMGGYGFPRPVYDIGWHWCEIRPLQGLPQKPKRVLFAPIHPLANGCLQPAFADANSRALIDILTLYCPRQVSVRHIGLLEANNLWREPGVEYHEGQADNSLDDILAADVVVAHGTYAFLAIALGVPTVMYGQDLRYGDGHAEGQVRYAAHWDRYREYHQYPAARVGDLRSDTLFEDVSAWRKRWIGEPLDPQAFGALLEGF